MHVLSRNRDATEQRFVRHAVIALRVIRWNAALVAKEHVHVRPIDLVPERRAGQAQVKLARGRAARERDAEYASGVNGGLRLLDDMPRGGISQRSGIR